MQEAIQHICAHDRRLATLIDFIGDIGDSKDYDLFEFIICEVVGQMLSNKVRKVLVERLYLLCDGQLTPDSVAHMSVGELRSIGLSYSKCEYIIGFAKSVCSGTIKLDDLPYLADSEVYKILLSQKGIGTWTTKMVLLFALKRPDILPYEDAAFMQGYRWLYRRNKASKEDVIKTAKKWSPYSSIAARYLYECVNQDLIKQNVNILEK